MTAPVLRCAKHGVETRLTCVECGVPICPDCLVTSPAGFKCLDHPQRLVRWSGEGRPRRPAGRTGAQFPYAWVAVPIVTLVLSFIVRSLLAGSSPVLASVIPIVVVFAVVVGFAVWRQRQP